MTTNNKEKNTGAVAWNIFGFITARNVFAVSID
jgi:hypothetical protein